MKRLVFISVCILSLVKHTNAQEQLTIKQQADRLFERYEYFKSLSLYLKLAEKKNDAPLLERIADCYRNINRYEEAEPWYARATANAYASRISHFNYAEVLLRDKKFDMAKQQYKLYFDNDKESLAIKLSTCDSAALWMKQESGYMVKNEKSLNTSYSDWGLNYSDKTALVFTSDRFTNDQDIDNRTGNNWFKLYEATVNSHAINGLSFINGVKDILKDSYHIGPIVLNQTADTAYITIATGIAKKDIALDKRDAKSSQRLYTRRLQLVVAGKKNAQWTIFSSFPYNNIQEYSVGNAALSNDGKVIYFTSDMPGGEGKTDIWYCERLADGNWCNPVNCGKTINTNQEEDFATIGGDGALYYSSKGLPGMGGYDIYKAKGQKAQWGKPENLKYPINTTSDDFYLVTRDNKTGYISSNREGGQGSDDIYSFNYKPLDTIPLKLITHKDTVKVKPPASKGTNTDFGLRTIYYDLDKSNIRPDAAIELDKLATLLKEHPGLKIELSSYTDSRASVPYNIALSERRADAAVAYLVKNGIDEIRIVARYYGKTNLVNNCPEGFNCTEAEHQLNRRTEFKMIGE